MPTDESNECGFVLCLWIGIFMQAMKAIGFIRLFSSFYIILCASLRDFKRIQKFKISYPRADKGEKMTVLICASFTHTSA